MRHATILTTMVAATRTASWVSPASPTANGNAQSLLCSRAPPPVLRRAAPPTADSDTRGSFFARSPVQLHRALPLVAYASLGGVTAGAVLLSSHFKSSCFLIHKGSVMGETPKSCE